MASDRRLRWHRRGEHLQRAGPRGSPHPQKRDACEAVTLHPRTPGSDLQGGTDNKQERFRVKGLGDALFHNIARQSRVVMVVVTVLQRHWKLSHSHDPASNNQSAKKEHLHLHRPDKLHPPNYPPTPPTHTHTDKQNKHTHTHTNKTHTHTNKTHTITHTHKTTPRKRNIEHTKSQVNNEPGNYGAGFLGLRCPGCIACGDSLLLSLLLLLLFLLALYLLL